MFFMNKKSRMCDNCKQIRIVKQIKSAEEYLTIIEAEITEEGAKETSPITKKFKKLFKSKKNK